MIIHLQVYLPVTKKGDNIRRHTKAVADFMVSSCQKISNFGFIRNPYLLVSIYVLVKIFVISIRYNIN